MSNSLSRRRFMQCSTMLMGALAVGAMPLVGSLHAAENTQAGGKTLIVYFSRTGNTATVATYIQTIMGGDLIGLELAQPYPEDYKSVTDQAKRELKAGFKPPLATVVDNMHEYTQIFVGSPNWWKTIAPPVMTFLSSYDMTGKTIIPFMTHEGSGLGRSVADIKKLCPTATVLEGLAIRGTTFASAEPDVVAWINKLGLSPANE